MIPIGWLVSLLGLYAIAMVKRTLDVFKAIGGRGRSCLGNLGTSF